tara:strand:+ start:175 stop:555 length:381 start_codon:yes stop_codon:yes gene_type:complete
MFSSIKIAMFLVIITAAGGGYWYVQKLQKDVKILEQNQVVLKETVNSKSEEIKRLNENIQEIREVNSRIEKESSKLNSEVGELRRKLSEHDLGFLAENKPKMIENIINKAIEKDLKNGLKDIMENK